MPEMPLRRGVHASLEQEADRLIRESLQGVYSHSEKADILTPWKVKDRSRHEMYVPSGTPDSSVRQGMFFRALNPEHPHLNAQDTTGGGRRSRRIPTGLSDFVDSQHARDSGEWYDDAPPPAGSEPGGWDDVD